MSPNGNATKNENQEEIVLRDLQSLLRKSIDKELIVIDYVTTNLLPVGENYGSTMLKVEALIKRTKNSPEQKLHLVAKMIPTSEFQKRHFKIDESFSKEIFMYEKLIPTYREIEEESGVNNADLIDILPKYYGGRLTLNEKIPNHADEDAVMIMENLKVKNYYTLNRKIGLDFDHAKFAIYELARFHALGIAMKHKRPEIFESSKELLTSFPFSMAEHEFDDVVEHTIVSICEDPRMAKLETRIRKCLAKYGWDAFSKVEAIEPWVTVTHGDFWVNNMMFHKTNGKIDDIKFIDFQISRQCSPLKDLPYFLCGSVSIEVMDDHFDELLDLYHKKFVDVLTQTGCNLSPFSRQNFDNELRKVATQELCHSLIAIKFFTIDIAEDQDLNDMKSSIMMADANKTFIERAWRIIKKYDEKNWF